jgi:transcriptional regulator with XRE-family HTH domain
MATQEIIRQRRYALGQAIRTIRKQRQLSQEQLAALAEIDRAYMGRIERGEQSISLDKIWAICDALQVKPITLFSESDIP